MNIQDIDSIAYLIDQAKKNNKPKPIVFLGAGASVTAGIPGAEKIKDDILTNFSAKPSIKKLNEEDKKDYYKVMGCLNSTERIELLRSYITNENVKLNVAHIYLAQSLKEGYIDYVLTVNFDDLILKASALFNFIPPVYDISILNDFTTETLLKKSVTYLHGQHNGFWLLNTKQEFNKVTGKGGSVKRIFDSICSGRTWIIVGYSGEDVIFDQIASLGCFTNDLFWVTYNDKVPIAKVQEQLLDKENTNAYVVTGYDADSFFLKLHGEISQLDNSLKTPEIFNTPFSFLCGVLENIKDIEVKENEHKGLFKYVKERSEESQKWIADAINKYEEKNTDKAVSPLSAKEIHIGQLKQEIIEAIVKEQYEKAKDLYENAKKVNAKEINDLVSKLYNGWGVSISVKARLKKDKSEYVKSIEKYKIASTLNPKDDLVFQNLGIALSDLAQLRKNNALYLESIEKYKISARLNNKNKSIFYNWGTALYELAKLQDDKALYYDSFEKFKKAATLDSNNDSIFYNWGTALYFLALREGDKSLYRESFGKFKKATSLNPKKASAFNNWGISIQALAKLEGAKVLYTESIEKYKKAAILDPKRDSLFSNWGGALCELAKLDGEKALFQESIEKCKTAVALNPKNDDAFYNWGNSLLALAKISEGDEQKAFFIQAKKILTKGVSLGGTTYNLACLYALTGKKNEAFLHLKNSLSKKDVTPQFVKEDDDWKAFLDDQDFKDLLETYK